MEEVNKITLSGKRKTSHGILAALSFSPAVYLCHARFIPLFWFLFFWVVNAKAQQPVFRNYNSIQGLPSLETYNSLVDHQGYMWFATDHGIAKYDGYNFQVFSTAEGLPDNAIFKLFEDRQGRIWFTSYSSQTGYIENGQVHPYKYNTLLRYMFPYKIIYNIFVDGQNSLWVNCDLDDTIKLIRITSDGKVSTEYNSYQATPGTRNVYVSEDGNCELSGLCSASFLQFISIESGKKIFTLHTSSKGHYHVDYMPRKNKRWIYTDNKVLLFQDGISKTILNLQGDALCCTIDSFENIWVGYKGTGVEVYYKKDNYKTHARFLANYSISSISIDIEGGMWFTSLKKGVYYLPPTNPFSFTEKDGLSATRVDRLRLVDSSIFLILSNYDFAIFQQGNPKLKVLNTKYQNVSDILYRSPDRIYYSGWPSLKIPFNKKLIFLGNPRKIVPGKNCIWGVYSPSIKKFDLDGRPIDSVSFEKLSRIKCAFEEENGHLLVGTIDGLFEYDGKKVIAKKDFNPVWSSRITDIKRIDDTHIAIATMGKGIFVIKGNDFKSPVQYSVKDGLPSIMCHNIFVENDTAVWVGTNKGACFITDILKPSWVKLITIDVSEGLLSNGINDIALFGKNIWIATSDGLSILPSRPGNLKQNLPVYFEKIQVNGQGIDKDNPAGIAYNVYQKISFFYTGLSYMYAGKLQYKYRLLPFDSNWYYTSNRSVTFNSLAPGKYTIELAAINPSRISIARVVSYSFEILPPLWKTWWFMGLMLILFTLAMYAIVHYRVKFIKTQVQIKNDLNSFREKALRAQMNPHFIYNSINSIQSYMLKNEMSPSISYLSKFSQLMRLVFSNTDIALVPLKDDLDALKLYIEMEQLRFPDEFMYTIDIEPSLNTEMIRVLPLLIQPFVENAILHGMPTKETEGHIKVQIRKKDDAIYIRIEDDGVGRRQADSIKRKKLHYNNEEKRAYEKRKSSGVTVTSMRIQQAWGKKSEKGMLNIIDLYDAGNIPAGTIVEFNLPLKYDQSNNSR